MNERAGVTTGYCGTEVQGIRRRITDMSMDSFIGNNPPNDGRQWECQCARCGSSMYSEQCGACGGEGITGPGELHERDPLFYDEDDYETCHECAGESGWMLCGSSPEYCESNPLSGRETIQRHTPEWFTFETIAKLFGDMSKELQ